MSRNLYTPRLSDDVVRALYHEGQRRRQPMTRVVDDLLRQALADSVDEVHLLRLFEEKERPREHQVA